MGKDDASCALRKRNTNKATFASSWEKRKVKTSARDLARPAREFIIFFIAAEAPFSDVERDDYARFHTEFRVVE